MNKKTEDEKKSQNVSVYLTRNNFEKLDAESESQDRGKAGLVRHWIKERLDQKKN